MTRSRLDQLLVGRGLFPTRRRAQGAIMAGIVYVDGEKVDKAGTRIPNDADVQIRGDVMPYVSRGGLKLEAALEGFAFDPQNMVALDVGASTGGFTDCLLQAGAAKVYAVDVGYGQLDWTLRNDPRVVVMERTNARYLTTEDVGEAVDVVVSDVSFIGLDKIFPAVAPLLKDDGHFIGLVKPQFEAGRKHVGKHGVVRDGDVHADVLRRVGQSAAESGLHPRAVRPSPITGPKGNVEYLLLARKGRASLTEDEWKGALLEAVALAQPLREGHRAL